MAIEPEAVQIEEARGKQWKCYLGMVIIGAIGIIHLFLNGDGTVLTAVITAESTLAGVAIVSK